MSHLPLRLAFALTLLGLAALNIRADPVAGNNYSVVVLDSTINPAGGAEVALDWGTGSEVRVCDVDGWTGFYAAPYNATGVATLAQKRVSAGLLLGQALAFDTPSEGYRKLTVSQPLAKRTLIHGRTAAIHPEACELLAIGPVLSPSGSASFENFFADIGLLPNALVVERFCAFNQVAGLSPDPRLAVDFHINKAVDLGATGFVLRIRCEEYLFEGQPVVTGFALVEDQGTSPLDMPQNLFDVDTITWEAGQIGIWIRGPLQKGHNLILLSNPGASGDGQVSAIAIDPLLIASTAPGPETNEGSMAAVADTADKGLLPAPLQGALEASFEAPSPVGTVPPDCPSQKPSLPSCETWTEEPASPGTPMSNCPLTKDGPSACAAHWTASSEEVCGQDGDSTSISTSSSWSVSGSVEWTTGGGQKVNVGATYSSSTSSTHTASIGPGKGCGECAQIFSGFLVRGQTWSECWDTWKWSWPEDSLLPYRKVLPCADCISRTTKAVKNYAAVITHCSLTPCPD